MAEHSIPKQPAERREHLERMLGRAPGTVVPLIVIAHVLFDILEELRSIAKALTR